MPAARKDGAGLTPAQREAATLEATDALTPSQLAERVGVSRSTVSTWRKLPAYQAHRLELRARVEGSAVDVAAELLTKAQAALHLALDRVAEILEKGTGPDVVTAARFALDAYRVTSAQVGQAERVEVEHTVEAHTQALAGVLARVADRSHL